uniref:Cuticle protein 6 n=1 Tax=Anopheles maculatus TaxID=74869 RepID=A0A182SHA4_9DIPT
MPPREGGERSRLDGPLEVYLDGANASWGSPDSNQYHIQTDEGPERYFRYQTDNGQFRKEKRLQDGTVIGTDAWIDASGYLRQNDYIADHKGYRILKSKTVFVGRDRPIQDAIKVAKTKPADSGVLVPSDPSYEPPAPPSPPSQHRNQPSIQSIAIVPSTPAPISVHSTPSLNAVFIRPHSQPIASNYHPSSPSSTPDQKYLPAAVGGSSTPPHRHYPSISARPPQLDIYVPSTTYTPLIGNELSSTPIAVYGPSSTPNPLRDGSEAHLPPLVIYNSNPSVAVDPNGYIAATTYSPHRRRRPNPAERRRRPSSDPILITSSRPYVESSTPATINLKPLVQLQSLDHSGSNLLDSGFNRDLIDPPTRYYDEHGQELPVRRTGESHPYDGVAVTNDGFRYYLPRQYHEERNSGSDTRDGSFGYIDPFGIRRVVYYNTGPNKGFVHRKNNRFVGFDATPYDPRPV